MSPVMTATFDAEEAGGFDIVAGGRRLSPGDSVMTDASAGLDVIVGPMSDPGSAPVAIVRLVPGSVITVRPTGESSESADPLAGAPAVEFAVEAGSVLVKLGSGFGPGAFILALPEAVVFVREETALAVRTGKGETLVSVRSGSAAVLPQGPLIAGLLDGRFANPIAGAVVRTALAFAPVVHTGDELSVGAENRYCEAAYSALLPAAERTFANGFVLEDVADPSPFIAAAGTENEAVLRRAFSAYLPRPHGTESARALSALDAIPSPGSSAP